MIVLDMESSGLDSGKCGVWQIGAIEVENPSNQFLQESRIDDEDEILPEALELIGKTEAELRDKNKQSQKQLILNFLEWISKIQNRVIIEQGGLDILLLQNKAMRYGFRQEFLKIAGHRAVDLHTLAQTKYLRVYGGFDLIDGKSGMSLKKILGFCGMTDRRKSVGENLQVSEKGTPHNALEDAKLTAECFSRLVYGKNLMEEFKEFPIPSYLMQ